MATEPLNNNAFIQRDYFFSAAHRIEGHPKCGRLHGHNYKVVVMLHGLVGPNGMVLDYNELDKVVKPLIDKVDHRYLVSDSNKAAGDEYAVVAALRGDDVQLRTPASTAECIAMWFFDRLSLAFQNMPFVVASVQVDETEKSSALYMELKEG
jgi:6-pyruvoyl tetrahydropterin synthase/QueD family protein